MLRPRGISQLRDTWPCPQKPHSEISSTVLALRALKPRGEVLNSGWVCAEAQVGSGWCWVAGLFSEAKAEAGERPEEGWRFAWGPEEPSVVGGGSLEGSGFPIVPGSCSLKFWGPPSSPGNPLLPGPGDPGVLAGEGGSPAGALPSLAACSPGILLLRDGRSRSGLQLISPLREEEGPKDSFLHPPSHLGQGPPQQWVGLGGPGQASKAPSHVLEPSPASSGHRGTLEAE